MNQFNGSLDSERTLTSASLSVVQERPTQPQSWEMCARAVLSCRPNSHPFQDRTVSLEQPIKIGRSVARARPNVNNAIFDCKVLSRNHALLWYETGKFYLQDTKSSNGTFVNNQRLSKSSEESPPREVCSGDIVQFGVDVMEVNKKVTHGCIVATLQLFLPDGKEAKASSTTVTEKNSTTTIGEIFLISQIIKEATQREQMIENKLVTIDKLVCSAKEAINLNWKSLIEEDRLLTRVDILERQLQATHKTMTDDKLKEEVVQLQDDKEKYQNAAKEALRKAMQDKMEAIRKYNEIERNLTNTEDERRILKELLDKCTSELQDLADKYEKSEEKSKELVEEIDQSSAKYKEEVNNLNQKVKDGEVYVQDKQKLIEALLGNVDSQIAKTILGEHNEDYSFKPSSANNLIDSDNEGIKIKEEEIDDDYVSWENQVGLEVETLRSKLKFAEKERNEIQLRVNQLINIFEDLKSISKKIQVSEYLADLINKLDIEIKQIKNFTQYKIKDDNILNNSYNNDEVDSDDGKLDNHISLENKVKSEENEEIGIKGVEKLLEESRQTIKALQAESSSYRREKDILEEQLSRLAHQLDNYTEKFDNLSDSNAELQSRLNLIQDQLDTTNCNNTLSLTQLEDEKNITKVNEEVIENLKGEVSALEELIKERDERLLQLKNYANPKIRELCSTVDFSCQTNLENFKDLIYSQNRQEIGADYTKEKEINSIAFKDLKDSEITDISISDKLCRTEEELAIFKDRYRESCESNVSLTRKVNELQSDYKTLLNQNRIVQLRFIVPLVVLFLAILIILQPSSS